MIREEASNQLKQWIRNGCDGMTDERLGYIEGWFHKSDKEALDMAIKALEQEPSGDFISRQAVLDLFKTYWRCFASCSDKEVFKKEIAELPSVKQEPKTGYWVHKGQGIYCSECGKESGYNPFGASRFSDYCPNCGAKMVKLDESYANDWIGYSR